MATEALDPESVMPAHHVKWARFLKYSLYTLGWGLFVFILVQVSDHELQAALPLRLYFLCHGSQLEDVAPYVCFGHNSTKSQDQHQFTPICSRQQDGTVLLSTAVLTSKHHCDILFALMTRA